MVTISLLVTACIIVIISNCYLAFEKEFIVCPDNSQWILRSSSLCNSSHKAYFCLFDDNEKIFKEYCAREPEAQTPGHEFVIRGELDGKQCATNRFQPFKLSTKGYSRCIFKKTECIDEGQIQYSNGTLISDRLCRCDYTNSYKFITKTRNSCFCDPMEEDCSCYKTMCPNEKVLSPEDDTIAYDDNGIDKWTGIGTLMHHSKDWLENDKVFIETEAAKSIEQLLQTNSHVIVVGGHGSGKTAIIRHIALKLIREQKYDNVAELNCFSDLLNILSNLSNTGIKLFFVIDNITDEQANSWFSNTGRILKNKCKKEGNIKLLISCEKQVYTDLSMGRDRQAEAVCFLDDHRLNFDDISKVVSVYLQCPQISDVCGFKQHLELDASFLCNLCHGKSIGSIVDLLRDPLKYIQCDLTDIRQRNPLEFCIMTLITLHDNCFKAEWLYNNTCLPEDLITGLKIVCHEFDIDLTDKDEKGQVVEKFEQSDTKYVIRSDDKFHLVHTTVFETMAFLCSKHFCAIFIQHASLSFISKRCLFVSITNTLNKNTFRVEKDNEQMYFDRIFTDFENGEMLSTFYNSQLVNKLYRERFIQCCQENKCKFKNVLSKFPITELISEGYLDIVRLLLNMDCDVNATDTYNRTALFLASSNGYSEIVKLLADNGGDISFCDKNGRTPLYAACENGHVDVVKCLLDLKVDVLKPDNSGRSPLYIACAVGHIGIVKTLLNESKCDISQSDHSGKSPLFVAVTFGKIEIVNILLEHSANIEQSDKRGFTPLFAAADQETSRHTKLMKILLDNKADIFHCDTEGRTVISMACQKGYQTVINVLLEHNYDVMSNWGKTQKSPLFIACEYGHGKLVKVLALKTTINQVDTKGRSPLYIACCNGHKDVVDAMIAHNADVDLCDKDGRSPLYISGSRGFVEIMKKLLDKKAKIMLLNRWGASVLIAACREGHLNAVKLLIENNIDISKADIEGKTAVYEASHYGHFEIVDILLKEGANMNAQTCKNLTPLHTACARGYGNIAQLLLDNGAEKEITNICNATPKD
ncbi:uncharacterized protein LOC134697920 [Mytilus trossulus]|uniref:uncharacterized protein LOC134697920 n=1 Tax=Mytilus trossulus TaxID=6551 RepID=UPI003003ADC7